MLVADIVVPTYNEAKVLRHSIERLHAYLSKEFPFTWQITIADNASTDGTLDIAHRLAAELQHVRVVQLATKGRGLALRTAWSSSSAEVVAYMDVDLSTGLNALLPMVAAIHSGHSELAIGSRLAPGAMVARGPRRELISRCYNLILRIVFLNRFRDAQCGFKAVRTDIAHKLLPLVSDNAWFFDTELLLIAEHNGLRVLEVQDDWGDDPDSRVHIASTARDDLKGVARVASLFAKGGGITDLGTNARPHLADDMGRQFVSFAVIGLLSTVSSLGLFLGGRTFLSAPIAAGAAFSLVTLFNSWANRRFTFGHRGRLDRATHLLRLAVTFLLGLSATVAVAIIAHGPLWRESLALLAVWLPLAAIRFALLRTWVFRSKVHPLLLSEPAPASNRVTKD